MNLIGKIKFIGEEVAITENFRKRDVVITDESNPQYPQHISMQCTQDKCMLLNNFNVGDIVNVSFNLRGKPYKDKNTGEEKYFNSVEIWKIENTTTQQPLSNPITDKPRSYEEEVAPGSKYPNTLPEGYVSPVANTL